MTLCIRGAGVCATEKKANIKKKGEILILDIKVTKNNTFINWMTGGKPKGKKGYIVNNLWREKTNWMQKKLYNDA